MVTQLRAPGIVEVALQPIRQDLAAIRQGRVERRERRARRVAALVARQHAEDLERVRGCVLAREVEVIFEVALDAYLRHVEVGR